MLWSLNHNFKGTDLKHRLAQDRPFCKQTKLWARAAPKSHEFLQQMTLGIFSILCTEQQFLEPDATEMDE